MEERRPRHVDQVWAERFLIAVRCQEAAAVRESMLRQFERLSPHCRDDYMRHRISEILKELNASESPVDAAPSEAKIQEVE
jgi:hypothetical protein